jgi:hypothetical protein
MISIPNSIYSRTGGRDIVMQEKKFERRMKSTLMEVQKPQDEVV